VLLFSSANPWMASRYVKAGLAAISDGGGSSVKASVFGLWVLPVASCLYGAAAMASLLA